MKKYHSFYFAPLLVLLSLLPLGLAAQPEGQTKVMECSFLYWDGIPEEKLYFRMGVEYHPMEFRRGSRAGKISLKRMAKFEVFREVENPVEGELPYEFLASAAVPGHINKVLFLVIAPDEKEEGQYRVVAMDDALESFPRRTFRFVNLTEQMISVEFAGETQEVDVSENVVMQTKVDEKGGFIPCIMRNPEGKIIFGTRLFCQPNGREIVFIRPSVREGSNVPRMKFVAQPIGTAPVENNQ